MSASKPTIQVRQVHTVGVPVTDQDRALSFYVDTLGFDKRMDAPMGGGKRWIVVGAPNGTTTIALELPDDRGRAGVETGIRLVSNDVDRDHAALRASGVEVGEILRWPGVPPMFALRDQDGNGLEIIEDVTA
jgi:lactoylglutathione lyase